MSNSKFKIFPYGRSPEGKQNSKLPGGFSLLETMVAIGIIMVGLTSALVLMSSSAAAVTTVRERLVAANLVEEGFEVIRNIRDSNWLQSLSFNNNLADGVYQAAYNSPALTICPGGNCNLLLFDSGTGLYSYTSGTATPYTRKITITNIPPQEIRVEVSVTWVSRNKTLTAAAEDHLFDWK